MNVPLYAAMLLITIYLGALVFHATCDYHNGGDSFFQSMVDALLTTIGVVTTLGVGWVILSGSFALLS